MIDLESFYQRAGYFTGPLLPAGADIGLREDAVLLQRHAERMGTSTGDFNLEAVEGGYLGQFSKPEGTTTIAGVLRKVSNVVIHSRAAAEIAQREDLRQLAALLTASPNVELVHSIMWFKAPVVGSAKPPHQDAAYLEGNPEQYVTFWIAIDDCYADNGCLQVVPGSHRSTFSHQGVEPQVEAGTWSGLSRIDILLPPGWGIAFHPRLLHASAANTSQRSRRALMLRYRGR